MARAGFYPISSGQITFARDGRWYCDGEAIPNPAIARLFSRALEVLPDGRGRLALGGDTAFVTIEDTPWVVTTVDGSPPHGFTITLNDGTTEPLDATTLRVGAENVLYCRVKRHHPARFLRPAYYALLRFAEPAGDGAVDLPIGAGRSVRLATPVG
jgi:hypothetical protein